MRHARTILNDFRNGNHLPDDELALLKSKMEQLADLASEFGEIFTLQFAYAQHVVNDCYSFQQARAEQKSQAERRRPMAYDEIAAMIAAR